MRDANSNRLAYVYDGFDRLSELHFPVTALGAATASASDYESYGYDANSNRTSLRLRSGETIAFGYDALNRETLRDLPGAAANDVYSAYDLAGRRQSARFASAGGSGIIYAYDSAGRLASETSTIGTSRALGFQYDAASNRTRITWPDSVYAQYDYDALNRVSAVRENGAASGVGVLATYSYDPLSRRASVTRGNGSVSTYAYDNASRLTGLTQDLAGGAANDQTYGFSYTAASQISQRTAANDNYNWTGPNVSRAYNRNGLNQYTSVGGASFTYDLRGNLTSDGFRTFTYDLENRLLSVSGADSLSLAYDPLGRLRSTTANGVSTEFLYDGDRLIAEFDGSGTLLRRYVHGPGVDEPVVWYEGSGLTDRRWLAADHLGSIVATNDNAGATTIQAYGPYGEPLSWSGSRFRYTGQMALPEAQLYHYRARVYDPVLGRFLQTDPVGYEADYNLYAYVENDPLNRSDPTGMLPPEGSIEEQRMFQGAHDTAAQCGNGCAVAGAALGVVLAAPIVAAGVAEAGALALANPVAVTEAIAVAGEIAAPGATLAGGTAALAGRASEIHGALNTIAQARRTTAVVETAEGGRFVGSSSPTLSPAQRASLQPGETAARGAGHAEITAANAAEAAGQTPVAVGASRAICPECQRELTERGIRH